MRSSATLEPESLSENREYDTRKKILILLRIGLHGSVRDPVAAPPFLGQPLDTGPRLALHQKISPIFGEAHIRPEAISSMVTIYALHLPYTAICEYLDGRFLHRQMQVRLQNNTGNTTRVENRFEHGFIYLEASSILPIY